MFPLFFINSGLPSLILHPFYPLIPTYILIYFILPTRYIVLAPLSSSLGWFSLGLIYSFFCSSFSRCLFMTWKRLPTLILPRFLLTRHVGSIIRELFLPRPRKWQTTPILVKISSRQLSREKLLPTPPFSFGLP